MMKRAPLAIFLASLKYCGITSRSWRLWLLTTAPRKKRVAVRVRLPARRPAFMSENMRSSPTESVSNTGLAWPW